MAGGRATARIAVCRWYLAHQFIELGPQERNRFPVCGGTIQGKYLNVVLDFRIDLGVNNGKGPSGKLGLQAERRSRTGEQGRFSLRMPHVHSNTAGEEKGRARGKTLRL